MLGLSYLGELFCCWTPSKASGPTPRVSKSGDERTAVPGDTPRCIGYKSVSTSLLPRLAFQHFIRSHCVSTAQGMQLHMPGGACKHEQHPGSAHM